MSYLTCTGLSGLLYHYYPTPPNPQWLEKPGNYLFVRWLNSLWIVQYVGECEKFSERVPSHDRWDEAVRDYSVTHVFSRINSDGVDARRREERDIIQAYNPPMNVHHRTNHLPSLQQVGGIADLSLLGQALLRGKQ